MSKRNKPNRLVVPFMILLGAAAGTLGLALYVKMTPADRIRTEEPAPQIPEPKTVPVPAGQSVMIPVPKREGEKLKFDTASFTIPDGSDPRIEAVNEFLRRSPVGPEGAKLRQITIEEGEARLDFSPEIEAGQGSFDEATLIQGLRAVLGQFPEIQRFRLFTGGREIKEMGHFELGDPFDVLPVNRWRDPESSDAAPPPSMPR